MAVFKVIRFNNYLFVFLISIYSIFFSIAQSHSKQHDHDKQHSRVGSHGMALFTDGKTLFASHMPLYNKPHDYQLIYQVESNQKNKIINYFNLKQADTKTNRLVSILPQRFDLNLLINNHPLIAKADVYMGHFERDGEIWLKDVQFRFTKLVFKKQILKDDNTLKTQWQVLKTGSKQDYIFVHIIKSQPSFDAIILAKECDVITEANLLKMQTIQKKPVISESFNCEKQTVLYYETQDFME